MLNRYSPLSALLQRRAADYARRSSRKPPLELTWKRLDSEVAPPLPDRYGRYDRYWETARFSGSGAVVTTVTAITWNRLDSEVARPLLAL